MATSVELWGSGDIALWMDIAWDLEFAGLLFDFGPVVGGYFVSMVDAINLFTMLGV